MLKSKINVKNFIVIDLLIQAGFQSQSQKDRGRMKLLGAVLQNKKGENILMASAPALPMRSCAVYSHMIYQHILEVYRNRLKIERTITLEENLLCVCNITKDYILYIFTSKYDLPLAFDGIRKFTEYFNKAGSTPSAKLQLVSKRTVEFMSLLEQFLYTRELAFRDYISMKSPYSSKKKSVDDEIFNKFAHIGTESDKNTIFTSQIMSGKVEGMESKRKIKIIENAQNFQVKSLDDMYLLDVDPEKQKYINGYKKNIFHLAMIKKRKNKQNSTERVPISQQNSTILIPSESIIGGSSLFIKSSEADEKEPETQIIEKIKIKTKEKLALELRNDKVKEVQQHGQIFVEGLQAHEAIIRLINEPLWGNPKILSKRITPNSIPCEMISEFEYKIKTAEGFKSKPVIDYVLRTETFSPQKIPLLFVYTMEVNSSNIEFTFKYKMNEKWKNKILDLDIVVYLNKDFVVLDCKSIPVAHSLKNNKVAWKTKEINPGASNSKGKILLAFGQAKFPPKQILSEIRLSMRSHCGLMEPLGVLCKQNDVENQCSAERLLLIEYKIHP